MRKTKMTEEFNLSDKIEYWEAGERNTILLEDVKEFIKRENETIMPIPAMVSPDFIEGMIFARKFLEENRIKLAGEKLK